MRQFLAFGFVALEYCIVPCCLADLLYYLVNRFLVPLPVWVALVANILFFLVNFLVYPFAMSLLLAIAFAPGRIWAFFKPPEGQP